MSSEAALEETNLSSNEAASAPTPPVVDLSPETVIAAAAGMRAAVVAGPTAALPTGYGLVVVCEGRAYDPVDAVLDGYPAGADLYFRTDRRVAFPDGAQVLTLGVDVLQWRFGGFTRVDGAVSVGPAHPAYAAANLAFQRGATEIDVLGLSAGEKERLAPWFAELPTHAVDPAQVAVSIL